MAFFWYPGNGVLETVLTNFQDLTCILPMPLCWDSQEYFNEDGQTLGLFGCHICLESVLSTVLAQS